MIMMRHFSFRLGVNESSLFSNLTQRRIRSDVSGQTVGPIFKGQAGQDDYHYDDNVL